MNKTKIEWCDYTWNPVTGCLHNCPYCYARDIARRFAARDIGLPGKPCIIKGKGCNTTPMFYEVVERQASPFPVEFAPTFHRYRLDEPQKIKKPQNIFVCSMADLFGDWVPAEWIEEVFHACERAPQHQYLFLTKNPARYIWDLNRVGKTADNMWFGATINTQKDVERVAPVPCHNGFVSIEPILEPITLSYFSLDWVIIGAETGNRKGKIIPKREWIESIVNRCRERGTPVFMKNSLADVWGEPLIREFPWEVKAEN